MEYRRFGNDIVVRVDKGEELLAAVAEVCEKENILTSRVTGLGAVSEITLGIYALSEKKYYSKTYTGDYEIASLVGSTSRQDGKPYLHLHATIGNIQTDECHGGHLSHAVIGATGEIVINVIDGAVGRKLDDEVGLNLFAFDK